VARHIGGRAVNENGERGSSNGYETNRFVDLDGDARKLFGDGLPAGRLPPHVLGDRLHLVWRLAVAHQLPNRGSPHVPRRYTTLRSTSGISRGIHTPRVKRRPSRTPLSNPASPTMEC
jgi:hypothetical protein